MRQIWGNGRWKTIRFVRKYANARKYLFPLEFRCFFLPTSSRRRQFLRSAATYAALTGGVARADFARYALLYQYGGVYADMDFECKRPFERLLKCAEWISVCFVYTLSVDDC